MPSLRRSGRSRRDKNIKPEVVTGDFELNYEDIIYRNRFMVIVLFATGLVLIAAFIPNAVHDSLARDDHVLIEAEAGEFINPDNILEVNGDSTASDGRYIEFTAP